MPVLTEIVGVPTLPAGATDLKLTVILDPPYQGGPSIGLSAAEYNAVRNGAGNGWVFESSPAAPFAIPMARLDVSDAPPPDGWLRAIITYTQNGVKRRTEPKDFRPIAGSNGTLDLSVNQNPPGILVRADVQLLLDQVKSNTQQITAALTGLGAAQATANAAQAAANAALQNANAARSAALGVVADAEAAIGLTALASSIAAQSADAANLSAQVARDAAATLPCPPVADANARANFFATKSGDCSCLQVDTLHVWQRLNSIITDLGPNSKAIGSGAVKPVSLTAGLAAMQGLTNGDLFTVRGAQQEADGGGGTWVWVETTGARPAQDGILTTWHATLSNGYFRRQWNGIVGNFAWAGLVMNSGAAAVEAALAVFAGQMVQLDKFYELERKVAVPANTLLYGRYGAGFRSIGSIRTLLVCAPGVMLQDVNVDGNVTALARNQNFTTEALVVSQGTLQNPVQIIRLNAINAPDHVIYGYSAHGTRIERLRIDGSCAEAVYFQMSDALYIDGVIARNCQHDTVKIHSKDGQVANLTYEIKQLTIRNLFLDYSMVTITGDTLALEMWGGQTAFIRNAAVDNVQVKSPLALNGGAFWGISADTCASGVVTNFTVDSEGRGTIVFGIEAAGCVNFTYMNGKVIGYKYIGGSMSQPATRNTKFDNVSFLNAVLSPNGDTYAIQWYNGIKGGDVLNCMFKDAGHRYLYWNDAGSNALVQGNHFLVGAQTVSPLILYTYQSPKNVRILDNEFGPTVWPGDVASTTAWARPGEIANALGWIISRNTFDGLKPDGTAGTGATLSSFGGGGGHRYESNVGYNYPGAFLGCYNDGPACSFLNNYNYNSTVPAQDSRSKDTLVIGGIVQGGTTPVGSYVVLPKQSVTNATLRTGFPDKVVSSCVLNDDNPPHGFPTTKGTLKTDRTGWELTQYAQFQYDRQTWIPYDGGDTVEYRRHSDLQGNWTAWVQFGGMVAAAANPYVLSGVTGGTVACVTLVRGGVAVDLHPAMKHAVRSGAGLVMVGPDGRYYKSGAEIPGWNNKTAGTRVFLTQKTGDTALNIGEYDLGTALPSPSVILPAVELGYFKDATTFVFLPQFPVDVQDTLGWFYDDISTYPVADGLPVTYTDQWVAIGGGKSINAAAGGFAGKVLHAVSGSDTEHLITRADSNSANGSVLAVANISGSARKQISVGGRLTGGDGTQGGITFELDNSLGQMRLVAWVNGARTVLKQGGASVSENVHYVTELDLKGTLLRGRYWIAGQPRPEWQITAFSDLVLGAGLAGVGFKNGTLDVGLLAYTRGTTTLSDVVNTSI